MEEKALRKSGDLSLRISESFSVNRRVIEGWTADSRLLIKNVFIPALATPAVPDTTADPILERGRVRDPTRAARTPAPRAEPMMSQECLATKFLPIVPTSREAFSSVVAERNDALARSISAIREAF